ncbi:MAG: serine/threonine protein kinase [Myxococcales bacterium]|nr:serine/threonine protein kinase [Myxococcales bacterium]
MPSYAPGDVIRAAGNAYRVSEVLGVGGMGEVYVVLDHALGTPAVLKLLRPQVAKAHGSMRTRFVNEARVLARIRHRNVARVQARGETEEGAHYFVMEHLDGVSVRALLARRGALRIDVAVNLGVQLFYGLQAIHDHGVVHRDIKPDNLIVHQEDGEQVLKIIDFGIMRLLDDDSPEGFCGTPAYAAPEQLRNDRPTTKMDVFAAGCVLFELLTGHRPYEIHGVDERGALERMDKPAPPITRFGKFPKALSDLVASTLALDADARPDAVVVGKQLQPIGRVLPAAYDLNQVVTAEELLKQKRDVQQITLADLQAPTDPDGPIPPWMQALRHQAEIAKVLGEEPPVVSKPVVQGNTFRDPSLAHAATEQFDKTEPDGVPIDVLRAMATRDAPVAPAAPPAPRFDTEPLPAPQLRPAESSPRPQRVTAKMPPTPVAESPQPGAVSTPPPAAPRARAGADATPRPAAAAAAVRRPGRKARRGPTRLQGVAAMFLAFVVVLLCGGAILVYFAPSLLGRSR